MTKIHPSAIIGEDVKLGNDVEIGPYCVIEDHVEIGDRCRLMAHCYIGANTTMGTGNIIYPNASIGTDPEDYAYDPSQGASYTKLGNDNRIRENVTINRGTHAGTTTVLGDGCFLMACVHISHNCQLGNGVIMVPMSGVAGYCEVGDKCLISGLSGMHQFCRMGRMAVLSGGSTISMDLPPFMIGDGRNGGVRGFNKVGMSRAGFTAETQRAIKNLYNVFFRQELNVSNAIKMAEETIPMLPEVVEFLDFVKASKRGILSGDHHGRRA